MFAQAARFTGTMPMHYDSALGPHLFTDYAADLTQRVVAGNTARVLEIAAGTGIVTRMLRRALPPSADLVASDLNPSMLAVAREKFDAGERVRFQTADAAALPFPSDEFDALVCQFGVMFFPDKDKAYREAFRVLAPGGRYHFNVWDSFEFNPFARVVHETVAEFFHKDPPGFFTVPFGYYRIDDIKASLIRAGFGDISAHVLRIEKTVSQARQLASGLILGNPIIEEIEKGATKLHTIIDAVTATLQRTFGRDPGCMPLQAIVISARKPGRCGRARQHTRAPAQRAESNDQRRLGMSLARRQFLHRVISAAMLPIATGPAWALDYPVRPIRLIIPYPPGGVINAIGRPLAERMNSLLGNIVVENIGGGGGDVGTAAVSRARPDGYTMLLANSSVLVIDFIVRASLPYDPIRSFDAAAMVGHVVQAIAVNPSLPVRTLQDLVDYAKHNPGKLSYGSPGTINQLTGEQFKLLAESPDIVHVPYHGAGPAVVDLIGGQIPIAFPAVTGQLLAFHRTGKIRILAVTSDKRLEAAPDLPTVVEAGMPDLVVQATTWLLVPRHTPKDIVERISKATKQALAQPELRRIYLAAGIEPAVDTSPEAAEQMLKSEIARWQPIVKRIGLKTE
jgi:tripartite-type tricarboxylate transporter receptor subunit TctC/SAM-dependent methyltransferase